MRCRRNGNHGFQSVGIPGCRLHHLELPPRPIHPRFGKWTCPFVVFEQVGVQNGVFFCLCVPVKPNCSEPKNDPGTPLLTQSLFLPSPLKHTSINVGNIATATTTYSIGAGPNSNSPQSLPSKSTTPSERIENGTEASRHQLSFSRTEEATALWPTRT